MDERHLYTYSGTVLRFDSIVDRNWKGSTLAKSPRQAKSNLAYQYKRQCGLVPSTRVTLPDKVVRE